MARRSLRSAFLKAAAIAALAVFAVVAGGSFWIDRWLHNHEAELDKTLQDAMGARVAFSRAGFRPWDGVRFDDLAFQTKGDRILAEPVRIERILMKPVIRLFPAPELEWHISFMRPRLSLRARLDDVVQIARMFGDSPPALIRFGSFRLRARLGSLSIRGGRLSLISPDPDEPWRQDFENFSAFFGRDLFGGERLDAAANVAGRPEASFSMRGVTQRLEEGLKLRMNLSLKHFGTAYLKPHFQKIDLPDEDVTATFKLQTAREHFEIEGKVEIPQTGRRRDVFLRFLRRYSPDFSYRIRGKMKPDRVTLERVRLTARGVELEGSGEVDLASAGNPFRMRLESGSFSAQKLSRLFPAIAFDSGKARVYLTLEGAARNFTPVLETTFENVSGGDAARRASFSKMGGRVRLTASSIQLDEVWVFVNDLPLRFDGTARLLPHRSIRLEVSTYPGQIPILREKNPMNFAFRIAASEAPDGWRGRARLDSAYSADGPAEKRSLESSFRGLLLPDAPVAKLPRALIDGADFRAEDIRVSQSGWRWPLRRFRGQAVEARVAYDAAGMKLKIGGRAKVGGGGATSQGIFDLKKPAQPVWNASGELAGADLASTLEEWGMSLPLTGRATGAFAARGRGAKVEAEASAIAENGTLGPIRALETLASETGILSLRRLDYASIRAAARWKDGETKIETLALDGPGAHLLASLDLSADRLMAGTLSVRFPESALSESSKLKWLLHYVGGRDWIDFDFRVAGRPGAPRLEWMPGEFKRKVESRLAPWMRRRLETEMGRRLGGKAEP